MKNLVAVMAVMSLALAGQCFAEDLDSKHDCNELGGQLNGSGQCVKNGEVIGTMPAAPAAAVAAAAGAISAGAVVAVTVAVVAAVAVAASSGNNNNGGGTGGTTGT
jgi:hypothetical protein